MSTDVELDKGIKQAIHAIRTGEQNKLRKGEKRLDAAGKTDWLNLLRLTLHCGVIGNAYESMSDAADPYLTATADLASAGMDLLQSEMDNFKTSCDILMKTLDAVAKIHPFVTGK